MFHCTQRPNCGSIKAVIIIITCTRVFVYYVESFWLTCTFPNVKNVQKILNFCPDRWNNDTQKQGDLQTDNLTFFIGQDHMKKRPHVKRKIYNRVGFPWSNFSSFQSSTQFSAPPPSDYSFSSCELSNIRIAGWPSSLFPSSSFWKSRRFLKSRTERNKSSAHSITEKFNDTHWRRRPVKCKKTWKTTKSVEHEEDFLPQLISCCIGSEFRKFACLMLRLHQVAQEIVKIGLERRNENLSLHKQWEAILNIAEGKR